MENIKAGSDDDAYEFKGQSYEESSTPKQKNIKRTPTQIMQAEVPSAILKTDFRGHFVGPIKKGVVLESSDEESPNESQAFVQ